MRLSKNLKKSSFSIFNMKSDDSLRSLPIDQWMFDGFVYRIQDAPTEIYLNEELHYPTGYGFSASPPGCLTVTSTQKKQPNKMMKKG